MQNLLHRIEMKKLLSSWSSLECTEKNNRLSLWGIFICMQRLDFSFLPVDNTLNCMFALRPWHLEVTGVKLSVLLIITTITTASLTYLSSHLQSSWGNERPPWPRNAGRSGKCTSKKHISTGIRCLFLMLYNSQICSCVSLSALNHLIKK